MTTAKKVRSELHISQSQVSESLGMSQVSVSLWETGCGKPSADNAVRYVTHLAGLAWRLGRADLAGQLLGDNVWLLSPTLEPPSAEEYSERDSGDARLSHAVRREFTADELTKLSMIAPHLLHPLADAGRNTAMVTQAFEALEQGSRVNEKDCALFHILSARAALNASRAHPAHLADS